LVYLSEPTNSEPVTRMEARRFQCEECGARFTIPAPTLERFPNWQPKKCQERRGQPRAGTRAEPGRPRKDEPAPEIRPPANPVDAAAIYTEGSCEPNPGDGGWAAVKVRDGRIVREASGFEPATTGNRMELTALVEGLKLISPDEPATVWTASELCFKTATVWASAWSRNGWRKADGKPVANVDLVRQLHALMQKRPHVRVQWRQSSAGDLWSGYASATARARRNGAAPQTTKSLAGAARV
jgi:ribonuclease HI